MVITPSSLPSRVTGRVFRFCSFILAHAVFIDSEPSTPSTFRSATSLTCTRRSVNSAGAFTLK